MAKIDSLKKQKLELYLNKTIVTIASFIILFALGGLDSTSAYGPNSPECFEVPELEGCPDFFNQPFDRMFDPYNAVFEDFTFVIVWAIIIGILWLRVSNTMMVSVIGVVLAALFTRPDASGNLTGFSESAQAVGWGLLILAVIVAIYQILTVRIHFPTN